jgi:hypothetical protein
MELKLVSAATAGARYHVELATADGVWTAVAELTPGTVMGVRDWDAEPPPWLLEALRALLRNVARNAATGNRVGPNATWPRKIQRWRAPP